jgi:hypothetical protein
MMLPLFWGGHRAQLMLEAGQSDAGLGEGEGGGVADAGEGTGNQNDRVIHD